MNPNISKLVRWILILLLVVFLFANPITRAIILFLLPLGSGVDDLIEVIAIIGLVALVLAKGWIQLDMGPTLMAMIANPRFKEVVLAAIVVVSLLVIPYTGNMIWALLLFGAPIVAPTFYVILGIAILVVVIGWILLRRLK